MHWRRDIHVPIKIVFSPIISMDLIKTNNIMEILLKMLNYIKVFMKVISLYLTYSKIIVKGSNAKHGSGAKCTHGTIEAKAFLFGMAKCSLWQKQRKMLAVTHGTRVFVLYLYDYTNNITQLYYHNSLKIMKVDQV